MREFGLLHEINLSLPFPRLTASLYDDCESSLLIESTVVDDVCATNLKELSNPPLTSLPLVASSFSNAPLATSVSDLTLLASPSL